MFHDKVVVITGGAGGIGRCIAQEFEKEGAHVCVIDCAEGPHYVGDIEDKATLEDFAGQVIRRYGRVDVLGVHRAVQVGKAFDHRCTNLALQINSSAMCDAAVLSGAIEEALAVTADTFQLNLTFYEQECFGVGQ